MRIAELDGLRGIAILGVLAVHTGYHGIPEGGWLAIDMLFVLSGYLITRALVRDESLLRFYGRRVARILPPVAATVALAYAIAPGFDFEPAAYLFANFVPTESLGSLGHLWYLSIEEQFYLVWPLAFILLPRPLVLAAVVGCAWLFHASMVASGTDFVTIHTSTMSRMDALAIGCALGLFRPRVGKGIAWAAFATALAGLFMAREAPITIALGLALYPFVCAAVVAGAAQVSPLRFPPLRYVGQRALGIYLYHYPVFCLFAPLQRTHFRMEWVLLALAKIAIAMALAELSYRTIERWSQGIDLARLVPAAPPASSNAGE